MTRSLNHIGPEESGGSPGGGPEDPRNPRLALRSQGLLTLAFGIALGIAFIILFKLIQIFEPTGPIAELFTNVKFNLWRSFLFGFVGGTITAGIYNFLILRRLNLFGIEPNLD